MNSFFSRIQDVHFLPAIVAALSIFFLGGIWYSKAFFGLTWAKAEGIDIKTSKTSHTWVAYIGSFIFALIAAIVFSMTLGPNPPLDVAVTTGFMVGLFFVVTSFGINYLFAGRSYKLLLIDGGYHLIQFLIYGIIFGIWQ